MASALRRAAVGARSLRQSRAIVGRGGGGPPPLTMGNIQPPYYRLPLPSSPVRPAGGAGESGVSSCLSRAGASRLFPSFK